jgi:hypothetical protein
MDEEPGNGHNRPWVPVLVTQENQTKPRHRSGPDTWPSGIPEFLRKIIGKNLKKTMALDDSKCRFVT